MAQDLYEVGPKRTQFQKGKSGNPCGQKKGRAKVTEALVRFLSMLMKIYENYKPRSVAEELARKLIDTAINGKSGVCILAVKKSQTAQRARSVILPISIIPMARLRLSMRATGNRRNSNSKKAISMMKRLAVVSGWLFG
jgi:hypothetical protein